MIAIYLYAFNSSYFLQLEKDSSEVLINKLKILLTIKNSLL